MASKKQIKASGCELTELKHVQVQLQQEKEALAARNAEQVQQIDEYGREIEVFKQVQAQQKQTLTQLEQEKTAQTKQRKEAEKLAAECLKQISELQQQIQNHRTNEAESAVRQQRVQEEMACVEAQLDLIKKNDADGASAMNRNSVTRRKAQIKQLAEAAEVIEPVTQPQPWQPVLTPHDQALLECARAQWQLGDWNSLTQISLETLQHHPARAELALLAAAG